MADGQSIFSRPSLFRTLFFVTIAAAAFVLIDSVLAKTEFLETAQQASRLYRDGQRLMQQRQFADAAEAFRSAIANARDNTEYPLALGEALMAAGKLEDAKETLTDLLKADSMAGGPNLAMARVLAKEGRIEEAGFYYHRAIFGQWTGDPAGNRVKARFELAGFLASRDSKAELLAELLPLQEQAPGDSATQTKLADLYMTAGSPARAASIFRDLVRVHPADAGARTALGKADFGLGDYTAAQADFIAALRLNSEDDTARKGLELSDRVLDLDPMRRGLASQDRYDRSVRVLQLVADQVTRCPVTAELADAAQATLKRHVLAGQTDAVEANLDMANKLWHAERVNCTSAASPDDEPLQLVLAKAAK